MKIVEVGEDTFLEEVLKSNIPVLVDFNANWCGPCRMLKPVLESIAFERDDIKIASVNVDNCEELAKQYGIMSIPCLIVFKDGKEIDKSVGLISKSEILELMGVE